MLNENLKNANILIVDDKDANIDILVGLLESQGYSNVKTTTHPRMASGMFKSLSPDIILLDLLMPHLSGYEIMSQLKTLISPVNFLPILVLTADITVEAKQRALALGARDFLTKPFDLNEVAFRIKSLLYTRYLQQQVNYLTQLVEGKVPDNSLTDTNNQQPITDGPDEESQELETDNE
jgi:PleD family two-component response regulator